MSRSPIVSRDSFLETVKSVWNVQYSEIKLVENGFEWLPGNFVVRVFIHEDERQLNDPPAARISVSTDYRRSVPVRDRKFVELAGLSASLCCSTYSWVYPPSDIASEFFVGQPTNLQLFSSAYITEFTSGWLPGYFARLAMLQPVSAEVHSEMGSLTFGGAEPAFARHPKSGNYNDALNVVRDFIAPEGEELSTWFRSDEFADFIDTYARNDRCVGKTTDFGMVLETPFGSETAIVMFNTDTRHPQLGHGLLIATLIDVEKMPLDAFDEAAGLNFLESRFWTDVPQLGCWHPQGDKHLAHSIFIPNAMHVAGLVRYLAHWALERVEWFWASAFRTFRACR